MLGSSRVDETVAHYRIVEKLGEGGMGVVYKAQDAKLGRQVALKFLNHRAAECEESRSRFREEARAAASLNHPNICTVYEINEEDGFLAMELIDGEPVDSKRRAGPVSVAEALEIVVQAANGLQAAHDAGIVHRDIKSSNLMVTRTGQVKIMDFGLARVASRERLTRTGSSPGTPAYMPPEVCLGETADERSDLWSLGVVLYELIAGRLPFNADFEAALHYAVVNEDPAPLTTPGGLPLPALEPVVRRALHKDRNLRYQSAAEFAAEIRALRREPTTAPLQPAATAAWKPAALLASLLVVATAGLWTWRERNRADHEAALQQVQTLASAGDLIGAYRVAHKLEERDPGDPALPGIWDSLGAVPRQIVTDPPGAEIYVRGYRETDSDWIRLGRSPIDDARLPFVFLSLRAEKAGYADVEWAAYPRMPVLRLTPLESAPPGMVFIPGSGKVYQAFPLDDFWLDRYETTNAEYKRFIDAGGYRDRKYWKAPFVDGDKELSWEEAMTLFRDATGRPGPAAWEFGTYLEGEENLPVTGVSWFEAAAYAEFMDKALPTVHHWRQAALYLPLSSDIIPASNFAGRGLAAPGVYRGVASFGSYDMAGNAKEWCWNAFEDKRHILGGDWSEPGYMFAQADARSPFERGVTFGFRCARYPRPLPEEVRAPITRSVRDYSRERPVSDESFRAFQSLYAYDRTTLNARIESVDDEHPAWRSERIAMDAAYGDERLVVYLFTPKNAMAPYQTVVHAPAVHSMSQDRLDVFSLFWVSYLVQGGRALVYPIYKGTHERRAKTPPEGPLAWRDQTFQWCKDLSRSLDYLEARSDIDHSRIAFHGMSMGARLGLPCLAVEERFKTAILLEGGLSSSDVPAETDPFNFAPRIRIPTLMVNGRDDFIYPVEQLQTPLFQVLGAAPRDKRHVLVEGGHTLPRLVAVRESLEWLDRHFGSVAPPH